MRNRVVVFDLDDTLYKEIDYLKSAYWQIAGMVAGRHDRQTVFEEMMNAYYRHENVFEHVISYFCPQESVAHLLSVYRTHQPDITLSPDTETTLDALSRQARMAIVSDGRSITQRNKVAALRLERFFSKEDILISEETGHTKPSEVPFRMLMDRYPDACYYYVGDNTDKDFIAPNKLGWGTICLKDNGKNIHPQNFSLSSDCIPQHVVTSLSDIVLYIC